MSVSTGRPDSTTRRPERIAYLDVLRAVAVAMVILSHLPVAPRALPAVVTSVGEFFRSYGGLGVDLFFVLSGFLVSGLLFREQLASNRVKIGRFLVRRGLKIYPAFYVFLVVTVLLRIERGSVFSAADIVHEALFIQNYGTHHVWSHTWSLAVEEHFYLLLSLTFFVLWRRTNAGRQQRNRDPFSALPLLFAVTTVLVLTARWWTFAFLPSGPEIAHFPTHLQIDSLFFGVLLSYYYHTRPAFKKAIGRSLLLVYAASAACLIASQWRPGSAINYIAGHVLVYTGFGALVIASVCTPAPQRGRRLFAGLAYVGSHSYSIYLWHTAVLVFGLLVATKMLGRPPGFYSLAVGYTVASAVVGIGMAKCVELPVLRLRDRIFPAVGAPSRTTAAAGPVQVVALRGVESGSVT